MPTPHFSSALSTAADSEGAEREASGALIAGLGGKTPDLVLAFLTHHHGSVLDGIGPRLAERTGARTVLGCTGESIIGGSREVEGEPGIALWAAHLPETRVSPFGVSAIPGPDQEPLFSEVPEAETPAEASILLLGDPYSFPMDHYLKRLNEDLPGVPAVGGMASGGDGPGQNLLVTAEGVQEEGAVGCLIEGGTELRPVVSQGCRPVGKPWVITSCEQNLIRTLGGRPALEAMMETLRELRAAGGEADRHPFLGLAVDPKKSRFERGDFLVRGIMGFDPKRKAVAVADFVRRGQTVQFLVRDAESAGEDLSLLMQSQGGGGLSDPGAAQSAGALLFSCNGRGSRMFDAPDHDISRVRDGLSANVPVAGFFAAGEIGPVGGRNFLHGFTASVAVFRPRGG